MQKKETKVMTDKQVEVFKEYYTGGNKMEAITYGNMSFGNFIYIEELDMFVDWEEFQWGLTPEERKKYALKKERD